MGYIEERALDYKKILHNWMIQFEVAIELFQRRHFSFAGKLTTITTQLGYSEPFAP